MKRRTLLLTALSASRVLGANERLRVGLIGCGGRCLHDAKHMQNSGGVDFPAVCDVYDQQAARAKEFAGPDCETYSDFRTWGRRPSGRSTSCGLCGPTGGSGTTRAGT